MTNTTRTPADDIARLRGDRARLLAALKAVLDRALLDRAERDGSAEAAIRDAREAIAIAESE